MRLDRLWLKDFRSYESLDIELAAGLTVVIGTNGAGKTNMLEAMAYLGSLRSFRQAPPEALVRTGAQRAVIRAEGKLETRTLLIETELVLGGRNRTLLNKQPVRKVSELGAVFRTTVFSPDDLVLVKGGPGERRDFLDRLLEVLAPRNAALLSDLERILRQRNAVLKQAAGRITPEIAFTLDVWDAKLAAVGTEVANRRAELLDQIAGEVTRAYGDIADDGVGREAIVGSSYLAPWRDRGLPDALGRARNDDVRRGVSTIGPHRDDVALLVDGRPSRTHASQGEQRTLALALRLAGHRHTTRSLGEAPLLLLDDVFSELDPLRSDALLHHLPSGQVVLATAGHVPAAATIESMVRVERSVDEEIGSFLIRSVDNPVESVEESASGTLQ